MTELMAVRVMELLPKVGWTESLEELAKREELHWADEVLDKDDVDTFTWMFNRLEQMGLL